MDLCEPEAWSEALNDRFIKAVTDTGAPMMGKLGWECWLQVPLQAIRSTLSPCVPSHRWRAGLAFTPLEDDFAVLYISHDLRGTSRGYQTRVVTAEGERAREREGRTVTRSELVAYAMTWYLEQLASVGGNVTNLRAWNATAAVRAIHPTAEVEVPPSGADAYDMMWSCTLTEREYEHLFPTRSHYILDAVARNSPHSRFTLHAHEGHVTLVEADNTAVPHGHGGKGPSPELRSGLLRLHRKASRIAWEAVHESA